MINPRLQKYWPLMPVAALLLLAIWVLSMAQPYLPLTGIRIKQEREAIEKTARQIEQTLSANQALASELTALTEIRDTAMPLPEKAAGVLFRERLEKGIAAAGLRTRAMGDVRKIDIADNIFLFEVTFSADGQTGELTRFMDSLYRDKPRVYWKQIAIKPSSLTQPEFISITGTLSALGFVPAPTVESVPEAEDSVAAAPIPESVASPAENVEAAPATAPEMAPEEVAHE